MLVNDFLCPPFSPHEEYFRQLCLQSPALYTNTLYNLFGHLFISNTDFVRIDAELEKINRFYPVPLPENSFKNLKVVGDSSVVFSRHHRYTPSRFHCHEYFEIIYQYSGFAIHNINGTEFRTKPGDLIILPPFTYHSIVAPCDDGLVVNIGVKLSNFRETYPYILKKNSPLSVFFNGCLKEKRLYDFILFETEGNTLISENIINALYVKKFSDKTNDDEIMIYLQSAVHQIISMLQLFSGKYTLVPHTSKNTDTLIKIMLYIKHNYKNVDLGALAAEFHFTEPYLSRMIKSGTGLTFSELLCNVRLNSSLQLLETTMLPVAEIAAYVGYKAPENYMRNFKSMFGITPSEYRKSKT